MRLMVRQRMRVSLYHVFRRALFIALVNPSMYEHPVGVLELYCRTVHSLQDAAKMNSNLRKYRGIEEVRNNT